MKKECDLQKNGPDEKNQEANLKKGGSKIEKNIGQKNHNQIWKKTKNFKRSENLMENKIKKMCYRKKKEKQSRNNISQICFRGRNKQKKKQEHNYRKFQLFIMY